MKKLLLAFCFTTVIALVAAGCGGNDDENTKASGFKTYTDPAFKFVVDHPANWVPATEPSQQRSHAVFYSSQQIIDGFSQLDPGGNTGAKIEVIAQPGDSADVIKSINEIRSAMEEDADSVKVEQVTVNGAPATLVRYAFDLGGDAFTAERYLFVVDSVLTSMELAAIGNFGDYKEIFDRARTKFQPGRPKVAAAPGDTTVRDSIVVDPPAAAMKTYSGLFTMSYPENFDVISASNGATFQGTRGDSRVIVRVSPTQGVTLDKIAESSKGNFGGRTGAKTKVGGSDAYQFNVTRSGIPERTYFVVKGDNLYMITMQWFAPQADLYLPAYDKMLASFRPR